MVNVERQIDPKEVQPKPVIDESLGNSINLGEIEFDLLDDKAESKKPDQPVMDEESDL